MKRFVMATVLLIGLGGAAQAAIPAPSSGDAHIQRVSAHPRRAHRHKAHRATRHHPHRHGPGA